MAMRVFLEEKLDSNPGACLHNRYNDYPEHPCLSACPKKAITLDPLKINLDLCDDCGICANVCPTNALDIKEGYFRKILESAVRDGSDRINIKCSRVNEYGKEVGCLGVLDQVLLAEVCLRTGKDIRLTAGNCGDCDKAPGGSIARANIEAANDLLLLLGEKGKISLVESKTHHFDADGSKRTIFKNIGTAVSKLIPGIQNKSDPSHYPSPVPRKRQRLLGLVKKGCIENKITADLPLPFRGKTIDEVLCDNCSGSIKCARFCPTNALAFSISEESGAAITFEAGKCIFCNLCEIACPKKALGSFVLRSTQLGELCRKKTLVMFEAHRCEQCERYSVNIQDGLCPDCIQREKKFKWDCVQTD